MLWCPMEALDPRDTPTPEVFRELARLHEENTQLRAKMRHYSMVLEFLSHDVSRVMENLPEPPAELERLT